MVCKQTYYLGFQTFDQWKRTARPENTEETISQSIWIYKDENIQEIIDRLCVVMHFSDQCRLKISTWLGKGEMVSVFCPVVPKLDEPAENDIYRWVFVPQDNLPNTHVVNLFGYDPDGKGNRYRFDGIAD
jgi:hypothetical protein